jgi:glutathione S-transferase
MSRPPIRLHRIVLSGHCHRVELLLRMLELPFEAVDVDVVGGELRRPAFLALNRFAQVPVIEDGDVVLADSNAILTYLARRYDATSTWLPADAQGAARVQRWLSAAAGPVAYGPGRARLVSVFGAPFDAAPAIAHAHAFLRVFDAELAGRRFLAADHPTIADLACYSYVAHAPEGRVSLADYPQVRDWLARIEALPGFVAMPASTERAAA